MEDPASLLSGRWIMEQILLEGVGITLPCAGRVQLGKPLRKNTCNHSPSLPPARWKGISHRRKARSSQLPALPAAAAGQRHVQVCLYKVCSSLHTATWIQLHRSSTFICCSSSQNPKCTLMHNLWGEGNYFFWKEPLMGTEAPQAGCRFCWRNNSYALHTAELLYTKRGRMGERGCKGKIQT